METLYGFPAPVPFGVDFVVFSNEDLGRTVPYSAGVDNFQLAMPYPSSLNLWEESLMVYTIEFHQHSSPFPKSSTTNIGGEIVYLSMLDDTFGANWAGSLSDADDEAMKSKFAGPFYYGDHGANITATAAAEGNWRLLDRREIAVYYPPEPLDLVTPLFITWSTAFSNITLATNAVAQDDDANNTELMFIRVWFTVRPYASSELEFLNRLPTRFQQLDS